MDRRKLLGRRLREIRLKRGISQEKLSELVDVDPATISNVENGKNYPSMINLEKIVGVLGVTFLEVFDFEHKDDECSLMERIIELLRENPERVEDFYKIVVALTK